MNKPTKKNFVELNKTLAKLHLSNRMPTASNHKLVRTNSNKNLKQIKKPLNSQKNQIPLSSAAKPKLSKTKMAANVSFEDDLDMAMTSAGYALYVAIKKQQFRDIVRLLEAGAHIHIKNGLRGGGPLHHVITLCPGELLKRFRAKTVELMLDYGVDPNLSDFYGKTALMLACSEGYLELVRILAPKTDPFIQDCRLNTALIYSVLNQKLACCVELLRNIQPQLVLKVIRIRNCNGHNALDLAKQLGNRELVLHLTHYLAYAEQNTLKSIKRNKLDPRYADSQWLLKQRYWRPDWLDYPYGSKNYPPYNNLYWTASRSMESLSTKDDFDDDLKVIANHDKKALKDRRLENVGLVKAIKNKDKALTNQVEIEKVLSGYNHLNRLDRLNLRRKLEEDRLNRAMSMYNLTSRKYYDDHPYNWMLRDDESVTSSMIFDYDLQNNIKKMHKQRLHADTLARKPADQYYLDQLMLSDNMFYNEPYSDLWQKETMNWFHKQRSNAQKESAGNSKHHQTKPIESSNQNVQQNVSSTHSNHNNHNNQNNNPTTSTTLPRRHSKLLDEQQMNTEQHSNKQTANRLPPMPKNLTQDYETWLMQQRADEGMKK